MTAAKTRGGALAALARVVVVVAVAASCSSTSQPSVEPAGADTAEPVILPVSATGSFATGDVGCDGLRLYPSPGTATASATTQISLRGVDADPSLADSVTIVGSDTGDHDVTYVADSDGVGASLFPTEAFAPGETVTVTAPDPICGADGDTATFEVIGTDTADLPEPAESSSGPPETTDDDLQHFVTVPDLVAPLLQVERTDDGDDPGLFLLGAKGGTLDGGPMIVDGDGQLVWFRPTPEGTQAADVRVQHHDGEPVLTWWEGTSNAGNGTGVGVVVDDTYEVVATVEAGNGHDADLHEFLLDDDGTAWLTIYTTVPADTTDFGGPANAPVIDGIVQQVDVATGNVLFEWHSLDHVELSESAVDRDPESADPWDWFHINAVQPSGSGTILISARNTNAVYLLDEATGDVLWTLGGKNSSFDMGERTGFVFQHDARFRGDSHITIFDNETGDTPARLLALALDLDAMTAEVAWEHTAPGDLPVRAQGNLQLLDDGSMVSGWGSEGTDEDRKNTSTVTEYSADGDVVFHVRFAGTGINTYRAYRQAWTGRPDTDPVAVLTATDDGPAVAVSWNGATGVASWEVVADGPAAEVVTSAERDGFETLIRLDGDVSTDGLVIRALDADGEVLGTAGVTD